MIFPIGDDQVKGGAFPIFSYAFIVINILVFVLLQTEAFTYGWSVIPYEILNNTDLVGVKEVAMGGQSFPLEHTPGPQPIYLTILSAMFMHGGWSHLLGNMLFLWVFADNIEATIGNVRFLLFYIAGGIVATFAHIFFNVGSIIPSLGASGAIAAVLGAYMIMFPKSKVKMTVLFFTSFYITAVLFLGFWIAQQLFSGFMSLSSDTIGGGTAWWAHIGGFVFGVAMGFVFRSTMGRRIEKHYQRI